VKKPEHKMERIILDKQQVEQIEQDMLIRRHIERYALVRQFLYGRVLDAACGVGYGSYLLAKNPDVDTICGVDCDEESIVFAKENYEDGKIHFECSAINNITGDYDFLVSLETIEHLSEPKELADLAQRCNVKEMIVSYPTKKTTHYNKYHLWDFDASDIKYIFSNYECINEIQNGDSNIMHFIKRERKGTMAKKYLSERL
jgi:2-polyprenyl-3-methyl-5-hydroxy-6-metoxy-1,4-benzoquinol methylase